MPDRYILLVEDNPDDVELTLRALRRNKIVNEVVVARDGAEALDVLLPPDGEPRVPPLLVLLDLKLPKVSGFGVLRRIRADRRSRLVPTVVLTASREEEDVARCYDGGANAYVRKPVSFTEFAEAVRVLGLFWLLVNEPPPPPEGRLGTLDLPRRRAG